MASLARTATMPRLAVGRSSWSASIASASLQSSSASARTAASFSTSSTTSQEQTAGESTSRRSPTEVLLSPATMPGSRPKVLPTRMKPASPSFYTSKPTLVDTRLMLDDLARRVKRALEQASVPINFVGTQYDVSRARRNMEWPSLELMNNQLRLNMRVGQYRTVTSRLSTLANYRYFVLKYLADGSRGEANRRLALEFQQTLDRFNVSTKSDVEQTGLPHHKKFISSSSGVDEEGRFHARGRRKESTARVWIVPKHGVEVELNLSADGETALTNSTTPVASVAPTDALSTSIMVNGKPISEFTKRQSDREQIVFPLRMLGMLGAFNVFALVHGGGPTGQTGAVAHGLARALVTYFDDKARQVEDSDGLASPSAKPLRKQAEDVHRLLSRDGVVHRDERMVERKKTGLMKARRAYTWVKR